MDKIVVITNGNITRKVTEKAFQEKWKKNGFRLAGSGTETNNQDETIKNLQNEIELLTEENLLLKAELEKIKSDDDFDKIEEPQEHEQVFEEVKADISFTEDELNAKNKNELLEIVKSLEIQDLTSKDSKDTIINAILENTKA